MTANLRRVAAFHEAGHAVAAVMRGGSTLTSVSLDELVHGAGITWSRAHVWDQAFIIWAGPWAEARHAWGDWPLDGEDEHGCTLADHVFGVFLTQPADSADYDRATRADDELLGAAGRGRGVTECVVWPGELQRMWPAVEHVAARLLGGDAVTNAEVAAAVDAAQSVGRGGVNLLPQAAPTVASTTTGALIAPLNYREERPMNSMTASTDFIRQQRPPSLAELLNRLDSDVPRKQDVLDRITASELEGLSQ